MDVLHALGCFSLFSKLLFFLHFQTNTQVERTVQLMPTHPLCEYVDFYMLRLVNTVRAHLHPTLITKLLHDTQTLE